MAINTPKPISRDERYLSKIGGNEKVIVPKPVSREEKYMYRVAGYNDQPIPDYPISRKEKYWAKIIENGGGSGIGSTVTFDSGQKFISDNSSFKDYKIYGNGGEIHPTGVLPLTFTAKAENAADWTIYGNDEPGENHWHQNAYSTTINNVLISADTSSLTISSNGSSAMISATSDVWKNAIKTLIGSGEYTYQYTITGTHTNMAIGFYKSDGTIVFTSNQNAYSGTFTSDNTEYYNGFYLPNGWSGNITVTQMLVKGSTAPDHYIPYQQGVGERTANLADFIAPVYTYDNFYAIKTLAQAQRQPHCIFLDTGDYIIYANLTSDLWDIKAFTETGEVISDNRFSGESLISHAPSQYWFNLTWKEGGSNYWYFVSRLDLSRGVVIHLQQPTWILICSNTSKATQFSITPGSTAPAEYSPYGYEIPLTINNTPQTFYIGDNPLTAGQSISKTSTGVDLELFEGENTVSTTLYNKPSMEIETSYGVGVKDNNHYIIPFKVNTTIYNIQIGDSPLYDGEYLSYKEKKLYKYIDSVLTPIDPPSPFPEISTTEGVNKVIIETSTQPDSIFITTQNPIKLVQPNIGTKTITQNGVYNASDDNLDGYSSVTVNTN